MLPYLSRQAPWFAFLGHPRDLEDLHSLGGSSLIRDHSESEAEFVEKMCSLPPTVIGGITFGFAPIRGELIFVVRMPQQMLRERKSIVDAALLAVERGARVVGLGALTSPATRGGTTLVNDLPSGVVVTTGNAYTAAVARHNTTEAAAALGLGTTATVAVVGCTGSVGTAATKLLDKDGYELVLVGRTEKRVQRELGELTERHHVAVEQHAITAADVVLLLTGDATAHITPEVVKPGSIVVDLAHPRNVEPHQYEDFLSRDVRVAQGGQVVIPDYHCTMELRMTEKEYTLACIAETYLFAKEGIMEHSVGNPCPTFAEEMDDIAAQHGVRPAPLKLS